MIQVSGFIQYICNERLPVQNPRHNTMECDYQEQYHRTNWTTKET